MERTAAATTNALAVSICSFRATRTGNCCGGRSHLGRSSNRAPWAGSCPRYRGSGPWGALAVSPVLSPLGGG
eukprot:7312945-Prorocentrum_lima.AAC.1